MWALVSLPAEPKFKRQVTMNTFGIFNCPNCVDHFLVPGWPPPERLLKHSRVYLECPGCKEILEVLLTHIDIIPSCEPDYARHARLVEIKPPDTAGSAESKWYNHNLSIEIHQKLRIRAAFGDDWEKYLPAELKRVTVR